MSLSKEEKLVDKLRVRMYLAETINGLESSAIRNGEKIKTIMMMEADQVKFQDSDSPSDEDLVKTPDYFGNEKQSCKEVERDRILDILPEGRKYILEEWKLNELPEKIEGFQFEVRGRVDVKSKEETLQFLQELYDQTGTSFNLKSSKPDRNGSGSRKCVMNTYHRNKETNLRRPDLQKNCPATLSFRLDLPREIVWGDTLERIQKKNKQNNFPLYFHLNFIHNHQIRRHEYSRFGIVSEETKKRFTEYFEEGMTASAAWHANREEITKNDPDHFHLVLGNGRVSPDYRWPYRFQQNWIESKLGSYNGVDAYAKLAEFIEKYENANQKMNKLPGEERYAKVEQINEQTVVVIIDAFMRRVHTSVPQSGDLLIMDATSNLDRSDTKLFNIICPSAIGGLPVGKLIVTREDEKTITHALKMYQNMLPQDAFYGRGPLLGPSLGLTDDSEPERKSLRRVWPNMTVLLCHFHVLQAHWQ